MTCLAAGGSRKTETFRIVSSAFRFDGMCVHFFIFHLGYDGRNAEMDRFFSWSGKNSKTMECGFGRPNEIENVGCFKIVVMAK